MNWYTILLFILYNAYFVKSFAESSIKIICQLMRSAVQSQVHIVQCFRLFQIHFSKGNNRKFYLTYEDKYKGQYFKNQCPVFYATWLNCSYIGLLLFQYNWS